MKIRTKLTLKNIGVTATALFLIFAIISVVSEQTRSRAFFRDLKGEAITKANLFLKNQVDARTMQSIYLNNRQFINEVEVAVYTTDFRPLYHDAAQIDIIKEDRAMIDRILREQEIEFYVGDYQGVGLIYNFAGQDYIVTAAAYDGYGRDNLRQLHNALVGLFFIGLALLFLAGYFLARSALKPIREIVGEAEKISSQDIDKRLEIKNERDELGELCQTFNALLGRLETSFNAQRQFVSNVSHELRTPLAAVVGQLDLALQKERTPGQYREAIENSLADAKRMTSLINGLLNLAKADYQKEGIRMQEIRLDELLLDVRASLLKAHPEYRIELVFDFLDPAENLGNDDRLITVCGNLYLLSIAFANLIENNCKYSVSHASLIQINHRESNALLRFNDNGAGMTEEQKSHIFDLFYRGADTPTDENNSQTPHRPGEASATSGHGIGMTLAQKIIHLHDGKITVHTKLGEGTTFVVELPHV